MRTTDQGSEVELAGRGLDVEDAARGCGDMTQARGSRGGGVLIDARAIGHWPRELLRLGQTAALQPPEDGGALPTGDNIREAISVQVIGHDPVRRNERNFHLEGIREVKITQVAVNQQVLARVVARHKVDEPVACQVRRGNPKTGWGGDR